MYASTRATLAAPSCPRVVRGGTTPRRVRATRGVVPRASTEPRELAAELASLVQSEGGTDDARVLTVIGQWGFGFPVAYALGLQTDLGVTGNIKSAIGMYGSTDYSPPYSESAGYQERTCVR